MIQSPGGISSWMMIMSGRDSGVFKACPIFLPATAMRVCSISMATADRKWLYPKTMFLPGTPQKEETGFHRQKKHRSLLMKTQGPILCLEIQHRVFSWLICRVMDLQTLS